MLSVEGDVGEAFQGILADYGHVHVLDIHTGHHSNQNVSTADLNRKLEIKWGDAHPQFPHTCNFTAIE